jgi:hypothetical protein
MIALAALFAALIGLALGALGGGGSILTVPVLVYGLAIDPKQAIATSLPLVGLTALVGALGHWRAGQVQMRAALPVGVMAMSGAYGGGVAAASVPARAQMAILAVIMIGAGTSMLLKRPPSHSVPAAGPSRRAFAVVAAVSFGIGVLTGLVGIGGGFLFVPALVLLAGVPMRQAVGTSLVVIAMNAAAGFAAHVGHVPIPWGLLTVLVTAGSAGAVGGGTVARKLPPRALQRAFGVLVLGVAAFVLWEIASPAGAAAIQVRHGLVTGSR